VYTSSAPLPRGLREKEGGNEASGGVKAAAGLTNTVSETSSHQEKEDKMGRKQTNGPPLRVKRA